MNDENEIVLRKAPVWAWRAIDETLYLDARSSAATPELRQIIKEAAEAMEDVEEATHEPDQH